MLKFFKYLLCGLSLILLISCMPESNNNQHLEAVAVLQPLNGSNVSGIVVFEQSENAVKVTAKVKGLNPNSKHGFHVHEYGDLSKSDGSSAGGHFNPDGHKHGLPPEEKRHAGSFGNIQTDSLGNAIFFIDDTTISVNGKKNSIIGRSVIIHEKEDDGGQPSGNAGKRIAAAVIGIKSVQK